MGIFARLDSDRDRIWNSPTCVSCRHLRTVMTPTCDAFPEEIPGVIWRGDNDHRQPFPGDHGIQYEAIEESAPAASGRAAR